MSSWHDIICKLITMVTSTIHANMWYAPSSDTLHPCNNYNKIPLDSSSGPFLLMSLLVLNLSTSILYYTAQWILQFESLPTNVDLPHSFAFSKLPLQPLPSPLSAGCSPSWAVLHCFRVRHIYSPENLLSHLKLELNTSHLPTTHSVMRNWTENKLMKFSPTNFIDQH